MTYGEDNLDEAPLPVDDPERPRPTKTKTKDPFAFNLDDMDDVLNPKQDHLPAPMGEPENTGSDVPAAPMDLPVASRGDTQRRVANITPSDTMRDFMNRINPDAGADEPELEPTPQNELMIRTARDVPAVISTAMRAAGVQSPEWHTVNNLPGFANRNIRGMGRNLFSMFTSTPLGQIKTIANVNGQGPNTDEEVRAVAGWLMNNAEDLGDIELDHTMAIPGYAPDVKEYRANGIRFHIVRDPMGQYIYAYPDSDARLQGPGQGRDQIQGRNDMPRLNETSMPLIHRPSLFERIQWDEEIRSALKESMLDEEEIDESTLSRAIGKRIGGQQLVQWLHRKHKLSNEADLVPASFSERIFWKQFKSHPDDFVIVSASGGVAGIKPSVEYIEFMRRKFEKKGKTYNPSGDPHLRYQVIAFTSDGEKVDSSLLQQKKDDDEEEKDDKFSTVDPTVIKARMGKHSGRDTQNPDNVFNLLAEQIGTLQTVYISGFENIKDGPAGTGSIEREKMKTRAGYKADAAPVSDSEAMDKIFKRIRPILKTLVNQAISQITRSAQRYMNGGNFEAGQRVMQTGNKLKQLLVNLDTSSDIALDSQWGSSTRDLATAIEKALRSASGAQPGQPEYTKYLNAAANGNAVALKPILDSLRDTLVGL